MLDLIEVFWVMLQMHLSMNAQQFNINVQGN